MSQKAGQKSRGNGEGSIRQRKDGRWEARITIGRNENVSQKMKYFYGKSRKEVAAKLEAYNNDTRKGIYIEPNKYTLLGWIDEWYKTYVVNRVKPTTQANYHNITNMYIKPYWGQIKLRDLRMFKNFIISFQLEEEPTEIKVKALGLALYIVYTEFREHYCKLHI